MKLQELNLRPCLVGNRRALFHTWEQFANVVPPGMAIGSAPGGQVATMFGIVEYEDGTVDEVQPKMIRFVDIATDMEGVH